jgi:Gpi18-like mannosyltransferase
MNRTPLISDATWKESLQVALIIYLPLRLGLSVFAALVIWLSPTLALPPRAELMARWGIPLPTGRLADLFLTPWLRFDALWYLKLALNGYDLHEPDIHHLPLYPALLRLLYEISGGHIAISALFISNIAFILALAYVYRLVRLDEPDDIAWRTTLYLAIFPTAFFYLVGYTESLFLLGSVSAFYYARQQAWFRAGLLATLSSLTRPQGVLICLPLFVEFLQQGHFSRPSRWLRAWPLLLSPLSVALYALYLHTTFGLPTILEADVAYWRLQSGWPIPGHALWLSVVAIGQGLYPLNNTIDLAFALFGLAMTIWALRTLRPSYSLFMLLNMLVVISKPQAEYPLLSMPRFVLPLFPMYILLGRLGQTSPLVNRLIIYSWLALLLFFSAQFALGGWVA